MTKSFFGSLSLFLLLAYVCMCLHAINLSPFVSSTVIGMEMRGGGKEAGILLLVLRVRPSFGRFVFPSPAMHTLSVA